MSNFLFSLNVTIPVFLVILLGYILKRKGFINDNFVSLCNKFVFHVALPVALFDDIATSDILKHATGTFVIYCMLVTILMFSLSWLLSWLLLKDKSMVGSFAQCSVRSSAAILGVTFVENICGNAGMAPLMIVAAVPLFNILSVIILTFSAEMNGKDGGNSIDKKAAIKKSFINILKNPIIIAIFAGMPFAFLGIKLPTMALRTIDYIGRTATPMALIAIGGGFEVGAAVTKMKPAMVSSLIKLLILPAVFLPVAVKLGFDASELSTVLIMLASPTTVTCYVMSKAMNNDETLAADVILITTLLSSVTLTFWVFLLRSMGLI